MLDIKVLGTGCASCLRTQELVIEVLKELGINQASVELVTDQRMIEYGLLADQAPGLLIDGYLAWSGTVPPRDRLVAWIKQAAGIVAV